MTQKLSDSLTREEAIRESFVDKMVVFLQRQ